MRHRHLSHALLVCGLTSSPIDLLRQCSQNRLVQSLLQHANMPLARTCYMCDIVPRTLSTRVSLSRFDACL